MSDILLLTEIQLGFFAVILLSIPFTIRLAWRGGIRGTNILLNIIVVSVIIIVGIALYNTFGGR